MSANADSPPPVPKAPPPPRRRAWAWLWLAKPVDDVRESWHQSRVAGVIALFLLVIIPLMAFVIYGKELVHLFTGPHEDHRITEARDRIDQIADKVTALIDNLGDVKPLVSASPDDPRAADLGAALARGLMPTVSGAARLLGNVTQPVLGLWYIDDANVPHEFDASAPEMRSGQFLNVAIAQSPPAPEGDHATTTHHYLLALEGDGQAKLYTRQELEAEDGYWQVGDGVDCETLLALAADHELSEQEKTDLTARLASADQRPTMRPNVQYLWWNGNVYDLRRASATRDLRRKPEAPTDWIMTVSRTLYEQGFAYHGYTYPVANEPPAEPAP